MSYLNSPFYPDTLNEDFDSYDEEFEENESDDDVNNNSGKTFNFRGFRVYSNICSIKFQIPKKRVNRSSTVAVIIGRMRSPSKLKSSKFRCVVSYWEYLE